MSQFSALNLWLGEEVVSFNGIVVENVINNNKDISNIIVVIYAALHRT